MGTDIFGEHRQKGVKSGSTVFARGRPRKAHSKTVLYVERNANACDGGVRKGYSERRQLREFVQKLNFG